jgi:hypothetical protein
MLLSLTVTVGDGDSRHFSKEVGDATPEATQRAVRIAVDDFLASFRREIAAQAGRVTRKASRAERGRHENRSHLLTIQ